MNQDKIGIFIKSIRLENNLTQKEFADILGVTYQAVSKWENGKNIPDIGILKNISERFNVEINDILNGEKKEKEKQNVTKLLIVIVLIISFLLLTLIIYKRNTKNFEFKTISSKCSDFKIKGSAAYNKEKTSIYISNIEFCGNGEEEKYKEITCKLYEKNKDYMKKISSCKKEKNINLKDYLKETDIKVDNYSTTCKKLTSNNLVLKIYASNRDNKEIIYTIPIKLNDNCKQDK